MQIEKKACRARICIKAHGSIGPLGKIPEEDRRKLSPTASTPVIDTGWNNSFSTALDNMRDKVGIGVSIK